MVPQNHLKVSGESDSQLVSVSEELYFSLAGKSRESTENAQLPRSQPYGHLCAWRKEVEDDHFLLPCFLFPSLCPGANADPALQPCLHSIAWVGKVGGGGGDSQGAVCFQPSFQMQRNTFSPSKERPQVDSCMAPNTPHLRAPLPATFLPVLNAP